MFYRANLPCVSPATIWCIGKLDKDEEDIAFVVIPFVKDSHSLEFYVYVILELSVDFY